MKLFVIATLIAVAAAGRLEHLERSYLPPSSNGGFGSAHGGFGPAHGDLGSPNSHRAFGANSAFNAAGAGLPSYNAGNSFVGATSNQYLPPDHGPSASNSAPQFAGSLQGFGGQQYSGHQAVPAQQYTIPSTNYGTPQAANSFSAQNYPQSAAASRQYLAPKFGSPQLPPQQPFDEETGYHY